MKKIVLVLLALVCLIMPLSVYATTGAGDTLLSDSQGNINDLALRVDELVGRVDSAKPTGTAVEQRRQLHTLRNEIDMLDNEIDLLDDKHKLAYLSSAISWEDYRALERELDKLEDKLDKAEDRLERTFHIHD